MSNFIIAVGHTASGNVGCGVVDRLDESNKYNCEDCYCRAIQANQIAQSLDVEIYVEIHINAGGGSGPEVCVAGQSEVANQYAAKVFSSLAGALNLPDRGVKTRNLIVLDKTVMPAILVECLFADSDDAEVYDPEVIARAIVCGLVGVDGSSDGEWKNGWNHNEVGWWYSTDSINKYYYTADNGWKEIDGEWYIFDTRGYALQDAWYYDQGDRHWYYLDSSCKMIRGSEDKPLWKWIDSGCYAFDEHGVMYCNCITPDGWKVDSSGVLAV